jgi:hypothetical protein
MYSSRFEGLNFAAPSIQRTFKPQNAAYSSGASIVQCRSVDVYSSSGYLSMTCPDHVRGDDNQFDNHSNKWHTMQFTCDRTNALNPTQDPQKVTKQPSSLSI